MLDNSVERFFQNTKKTFAAGFRSASFTAFNLLNKSNNQKKGLRFVAFVLYFSLLHVETRGFANAVVFSEKLQTIKKPGGDK